MLTHLQATALPPARVVILGAHGFVARALAVRLGAAAIPCVAFARQELDLTAPTAAAALAARLQPADAVVMTSALTPDKGKDPATLLQNLRMAESVAAALATRPCAHFLYLSSDAVYDWTHPLISEATPPSPTDLYSTMHVAREQILTAAAAAARIPVAILRLCAVYGPGDTHQGYGPNRFARTARAEGRIRLFGTGEEQRDHVCIDDVTAIIQLALSHRSTGTLNVVSGRSVSFAEVAERVAALARPATVAIETLPRGTPVTHRHFDPSALLRAFPGHRPTPLAEGLRQLFPSP